uniref:Uncharacterized protein n=1 Tax=Anopheles coluzzii TaxID=1518534 RepID=A0A8W7PDA1_ANOCL
SKRSIEQISSKSNSVFSSTKPNTTQLNHHEGRRCCRCSRPCRRLGGWSASVGLAIRWTSGRLPSCCVATGSHPCRLPSVRSPWRLSGRPARCHPGRSPCPSCLGRSPCRCCPWSYLGHCHPWCCACRASAWTCRLPAAAEPGPGSGNHLSLSTPRPHPNIQPELIIPHRVQIR